MGKVHHQIRLKILSCSRGSENHRGPEVPEVKAPAVECLDGLARTTLEELAITHSVKDGILQNACSTKTRMVAVLEKSAHSHIVRLTHSRRNGPNRIMTKALWLFLKKGDWHERGSVTDRSHDRSGKPDKSRGQKLGRNSSKRQVSDARQLGCVFQDSTPPKSILRKSTDMPKPIQRVKFTKAIARHTKIRDQNPSLGYICPGEPHERSPNAPKFEDRSLEETEWQELGAREAAWKLAKNVFKLKELERASFFSSPENMCHIASTLKPEEREFVVDSGALMHMISKKDLSEAEMDTLRHRFTRNARNATLRWESRFLTPADCCVQERVLEPRFNKELKEKTKSTEQQIAHARECVMKRRD